MYDYSLATTCLALEQDAGWPVSVMYCQTTSMPCMLTAAMHAHSCPIQNASSSAAAVANRWQYIAGYVTGEAAGNVLPAYQRN